MTLTGAPKKHLELEFDLGTLLAVDNNDLDRKQLSSNTDSYLQSLARDNTQLLINKIWELPTQAAEDVTVALLPKPTYMIPRALPTPKPKPPTKWELFAKEKGIVKRKKDKLKWDEILQKWVPLYGYKRVQAEKEKDWVVEVPGNADPNEDMFAKKKSEKKERVAKNEFQRLRNIAKARKVDLPKVGFPSTALPAPNTLGAQVTVAKASTASLGKFQPSLPKEKTGKNVKEFLPESRKRKASTIKPEVEKSQSMNLLDRILNKKPKFQMDDAIDSEVRKENREEALQRNSKKGKKKAGKRIKKGGKGGKFRDLHKGAKIRGQDKSNRKGKGKKDKKGSSF